MLCIQDLSSEFGCHQSNGRDFFSPPIMIWDVLQSFSEIKDVVCHICKANGISSLLRSSGHWTSDCNSSYQPRVIYDTSSFILLVSSIYVCHNNHRVPSHHPSVLSELPHYYIPFHLTCRAGFTTNFLEQLCSLVDRGTSFLAIEGITADQYRQTYTRIKARLIKEGSSLEIPLFSQVSFPYPHEKSLREVFLSYSFLFNYHYAKDMQTVLHSGYVAITHLKVLLILDNIEEAMIVG